METEKKILIVVVYGLPENINLDDFINTYKQCKQSMGKNSSYIMADFDIDMINVTDTISTFKYHVFFLLQTAYLQPYKIE